MENLDTLLVLDKTSFVDGDGISALMVTFDRSAVQKMIKQTGTVELVVTGEVADNNGVPMPFRGSDTIKLVK